MSRGTLSLLYWIVMITSSRKFSQGSISAKHLDSDAMLRDMPMHDEAPCCSPSDESSQVRGLYARDREIAVLLEMCY